MTKISKILNNEWHCKTCLYWKRIDSTNEGKCSGVNQGNPMFYLWGKKAVLITNEKFYCEEHKHNAAFTEEDLK